MVSIELAYEGDLHCRAVHGPSGTVLTTDAPKDNQGRGESFSPTDLVATGLGGCILTILGIQARTLGLDLNGMTASVEKEMTTEGPRRIARLSVRVHVPAEVSELDRVKLERAAHTCPVHKSLHPEIEKPITFTWGK
jgi:putative redox protein